MCRSYIGACRSSLRKTKRNVSTNPYMEPQTNIMTRKSRISMLVRMAFRPPMESFDLGNSRSMSIFMAQKSEIPIRTSAMMKAAR